MACQYNTSTWKGLSEYRSSSSDYQNGMLRRSRRVLIFLKKIYIDLVGYHAAELEHYSPRKKAIFNALLGSATIVLFNFCLGGSTRTCAHSSRWLVSHER